MYVETPLIRSPYLGENVLLKLENTQPAGSFKSRGMTAYVKHEYTKNANATFYSSSGGNAGLAAAEAAASLGAKCTVVVPEPTSAEMVDKIRRYGATVTKHGAGWYDADEYLQQLLAKDPNSVYCHPFVGEVLWDGHATLVDELIKQCPEKPAAIVLAVGGGGLYCGVMRGLVRNQWSDVPVFCVETEKASCFNQSLKAGKKIMTGQPTSIAKCLGSRWVPEEAIAYAKEYGSTSVLVSDEEAVRAAEQFAEDHRMLVEPACGAALAALYNKKVTASGPIVAIVCGGAGWSIEDVVVNRAK